MATLSILGLYNYQPDIFDGLQLPAASDITDEAEKVTDPWIPVKDDFIAYLCMQAAELEVLYPDPDIMAAMIAVWSAAHRPEWIGLYNTLLYKYNPIWNKDGIYTETRQLDSKGNSTGEVKDDVTGYNANTYSPNTRGTSTGASAGTENEKITRTESGNIGVTTTQAMIKEQREIVQFNLYDYISRQFIKQFCLQVY